MVSLAVGAPPMASQSLCLSSHISFSRSQSLLTSLPTSPRLVSIPTVSSPSPLLVYCGRGDRKTAKGKRFNHSFGNARPRDKKKGRGPPRVPIPSSPPKKDPFDDDEVVKIEIDESLFSN
ncbi:small ribosomal subunit protein bTHXc [Malania oleifera]|uniref:small ribosomal subunit protein bTHXc n=1 Tax=Malania oleifera TaxID=397392 RepID=UPI0025ADC6A0|nr:small ribosomal subunit protein bTHXc [Malania oleifera]XP_057983050.1 small ribosomal subunit protein bTHXc [Malania oleifera]XP_057983051.1 small ribosomal subunit protein bTHXc [Malania oleifera]